MRQALGIRCQPRQGPAEAARGAHSPALAAWQVPGDAAPGSSGFAFTGCTPAPAARREKSVLLLPTAAARRCGMQMVRAALQPPSQSVLGF